MGTTRTIPHRELRNNSAEVLRAVEAGETFQITNHGEVVAVLSPPPAPPLSGIKHYPARKRGRLSDVQRRTIPGGTGAILDELREER
ncbi:MAG: type II toxin-antitoxin system prevent-host-death family antitoxin [Cryobacterium sp.]|uniref:type II toxin-antitoxin system Phd/YefM family antitoxin n=1 Tax=Cryobacterium sp. TaxID=1926290 RepID=UPI00228A9B0C|nr:type II toxin-antitoxin system prevent-host-death family antitoxin [Cryobacterium sp.]MCY7404893.1 type II toxin-antitoxin system prevent-host-death family antitoxin [Cryobacterium sp.]